LGNLAPNPHSDGLGRN